MFNATLLTVLMILVAGTTENVTKFADADARDKKRVITIAKEKKQHLQNQDIRSWCRKLACPTLAERQMWQLYAVHSSGTERHCGFLNATGKRIKPNAT